jgi:hypothetical protein
MLHVGMNIAGKAQLFSEICRALKAGARFGIYDVVRTGTGDLAYPLPWASAPHTSFVESAEEYVRLLRAAGFEIVHERSRRDFALEFFRRTGAKPAGAPPPLGPHIVMGADFARKRANLTALIERGILAPYEIVAVAR